MTAGALRHAAKRRAFEQRRHAALLRVEALCRDVASGRVRRVDSSSPFIARLVAEGRRARVTAQLVLFTRENRLQAVYRVRPFITLA